MYEVMDAVKKLRRALGDTQPRFAQRLRISIRALANYEGGRLPQRNILAKLEKLARDSSRTDLERVFCRAEWDQILSTMQPEPGEEEAWVKGILCVLRHKHLVPKWNRIAEELLIAMGSIVEGIDRNESTRMPPEFIREMYSDLAACIQPSAKQRLAELARARSLNAGLDYEDALLQVALEHPDLHAQSQKLEEHNSHNAESTEVPHQTTKGRSAARKKMKRSAI